MNDLALQQDAPQPVGTNALLLNPTNMRALVDFSHLMADSVVMVPKHLHGKPADCMAVAMQAMQWGMNPFVVAQKTHVVNGGLGYEAQLVNAVLQSSGEVSSRPHYEFRGEGPKLECRVGFVLKGEKDITWGEWLCSADVKVKNSPLWQTNPKQQIGYLQVKNWARLYVPQAILGIRTPDEMELVDAPEPPQQRGPRRKSEPKHMGHVDEVSPPAPPPQAAPAEPPAVERQSAPPAQAAGNSGGISGNQVAYLRNKLKAAGVEEATICDRFQVTSIELLNAEQFDVVKSELIAMV